MTDETRPEAAEHNLPTEVPDQKSDLIEGIDAGADDPIGDETDGEAGTAMAPETETEIAAAEDEAEAEAEIDPEIGDGLEAADGTGEGEASEEDEPEFKPKARPPAKLERLQKILAQAGVASRRKAEEMIEQGRVQVNGKTVTELGTKADAGRDHVRVDGKLLQGAERLRYFVLNKPRGFVTTVKDPEGRPTVMQFFDKMRERLYPVGRLDYMSEGLLLVTNDGELANRLTRASAGVEKTYLVKVAGIPTESELDILRAGVAIEKGKPGSGKVRTSPARIRQVRQGDNPWYEVVLIEGRNRELRKMFEEVGHFVEKIRRVGYGPLILDQEPGHLRELDAHELELLRKAAEGKLKTPKAKEIRRRNIIDSLPPEKLAFKPRGARPAAGPKDYQPKKLFGAEKPARGGSAPARFGTRPAKFGSQPAGSKDAPATFGSGKPARPAWKKDDRAGDAAGRPPAAFAAGAAGEERPATGRNSGARPEGRRPVSRGFGTKPGAGKTLGGKPAWKKQEVTEWPPYKRPPESARRPAPEPVENLEPRKPTRLHIEPVQDTERSARSRPDQSARPVRSSGPDRSTGRPPFGRSAAGQTGTGAGRASAGRSSSARPFRNEGGLARPFTTSSGKPRAGGARPSSKPGERSGGTGAGRGGPRVGGNARPSFGPKRPFGAQNAESKATSSPERRSRPTAPRPERTESFRPRSEEPRPERNAGTGWKPKPGFSGKSKTGTGGRSSFKPGKPAFKSGPKSSSQPGSRSGSRPNSRPGGFSKSRPKSTSSGSGARRTGPRPGGKKRG
jgi:23S rRNA pseudouridine2605 synthase